MWNTRHVDGHQVDTKEASEIDIWGKLNIVMDALAKEHISVAKTKPRHHLVQDEPWSLWYLNQKPSNNISSTVFDIVHFEEACNFWREMEKIELTLVDSVNWDAIGVAMKSSNRTRWIFISKHIMGMRGVGKFMKLWKQ
jgi:hypothetical protein